MAPGISAIAAYIPPYRVDLAKWCDWYGHSAGKIQAVVGNSFRVRGPRENVYTMAAEAALRLIVRNQIDTTKIRFLALGTESSTDNSAGAVVVKGLLNQVLPQLGLEPISRHCEVPEFKHACLGGVYGLKSAARFLACEPEDSLALVICGDVAEYARGSSGEPTQGAGAVAMALSAKPALLELLLPWSGSASDYRLIDFRKPMSQASSRAPRPFGQSRDFPVFNGHYSTSCYLDATLTAMRDLWRRRGQAPKGYMESLAGVFMHRPYRRMPETGLAISVLGAMAADDDALAALTAAAAQAGVDAAELKRELLATPDLLELVADNRLNDDPYPLAMQVIRAVRKTEFFDTNVGRPLTLGSEPMMEIGNLYTAALPAWLGAGLEEAAGPGPSASEPTGKLKAGDEILLVGYGSGDAAEAIPARMVEGWQQAASRIEFRGTLADAIDLTQHQYEVLHDTGDCEGLRPPPAARFLLDRIGQRDDPEFADAGVEYYQVTARTGLQGSARSA
ncbi:MAG: hydroxymethylglutaryl-CoA synthase [Pseudomonadota bacterium]